jgi:hypothetical protein
MATATRLALEDLKSKLLAIGDATNVVIGEPRSPCESGTVAIIPDGGEIDSVTSHPREIHRVILRRYENFIHEPADEIEFRLDSWRIEVEEDFFAKFTLGGNIANPEPTQWGWEYGRVDLGNTMFRVLDFLVAYRVDPETTTFTPS